MQVRKDRMEEGFIMDDGSKVDPGSVPIPPLCLSCAKNQNNETACILNRLDQINEINNGEIFCCFSFVPIDPTINKDSIFNEMKKYLAEKNDG